MKARTAKENASKLRCYRLRLRGLPKELSSDFIFEKLIACFARHARNLYDQPDFVLYDIVRFGASLDLLVQTASKDLLQARLSKLKIPYSSLRCRPFQPQARTTGSGFASWLVGQYGLNDSDPGRRRLRIQQRRPIGNNLTYHVWNRTPHRRLLFGPAEKQLLMQIALRICSNLRVQLHAFVIMGNHFHLVVTTQRDVSISELMQKIEWQMSKQYNRLHQTQGTLWQGPFQHSVWHATAANLMRLIDYVHANPIRAGLVTEPEEYAWSSYAHYAGLRRRKDLVVPLALRRRWPTKELREDSYREHFANQVRSGKLQHDPDMGKRGARGPETFKKSITACLSGPSRLPAFLKQVLKLKREGVVWGLKTLLHLLCKPMVDQWLCAENCWKELNERIDPLLPVCYTPS